MDSSPQHGRLEPLAQRATLASAEATLQLAVPVEVERLARRIFQDPQPKRAGHWWYLLYWQDVFSHGKSTRKRKRHKLAPATVSEREVRKIAAEFLRPMNQGLAPIGSSTMFDDYV